MKPRLINLPFKCCLDQGEFNSAVKRYKLIELIFVIFKREINDVDDDDDDDDDDLLFLSCYLKCFPCLLVTILL